MVIRRICSSGSLSGQELTSRNVGQEMTRSINLTSGTSCKIENRSFRFVAFKSVENSDYLTEQYATARDCSRVYKMLT